MLSASLNDNAFSKESAVPECIAYTKYMKSKLEQIPSSACCNEAALPPACAQSRRAQWPERRTSPNVSNGGFSDPFFQASVVQKVFRWSGARSGVVGAEEGRVIAEVAALTRSTCRRRLAHQDRSAHARSHGDHGCAPLHAGTMQMHAR